MQDKEKASLIQMILDSFATWQQRIEAEDDDEKKWLLQNSRNPLVTELLSELSALMLHVLDRIGQSELVNGITIAKQMNISKGTVSKITRKLLTYNLIRKESLPDNKKEVLFSLTSLGRELFELHNTLHRQIETGVTQFLQTYDAQKLRILADFVQEMAEKSFLDLEPEMEPAPSQAEDEQR